LCALENKTKKEKERLKGFPLAAMSATLLQFQNSNDAHEHKASLGEQILKISI
jgi:hypothetical protein